MIATLEEIKTLTGLSASYDAQITALIPIVQNYIVDYTGNKFEFDMTGGSRIHKLTGLYLEEAEDSNVTFDSVNKTITASVDMIYTNYGIAAGKDISITGSNFNDGIYSVAAVNDNVITVNENLNEESLSNLVTVRLVNFPKSLKMTSAQIIKHWLLSKSVTGVQSERLGDYAVSYSDLPPSIVSQLNHYRRVKFI